MIDIIWITIKKHYILTICMFIMIIMTIIFNLLPPVILGNIVDMITHKEKISLSIAILYFISILLFALSDCLKELIINIFGQNIIYNTRKMMIDKIGGINPLNNVQNTRRSNGAAQVRSDADSISVSNEAKEKAAVYYMNQVAAETPDVRADRIAEVKAKLQNPNYLNDSVIASAADKLMQSLGL